MEETLLLNGGRAEDVRLAGRLLRQGRLVAIPTETVYGLACSAVDAQAVPQIFTVKGRPQDNPLIVHICRLEQMHELCREVPAAAYALARAFWPGPLTMVMKKTALVPDQVTAGLDTVGVRMPSHPVALAVIEASGVPLAAPSANLSGKPSPTRFSHVREDLYGKVAAILDGGDCAVGVESTVLDLTCDPPRILRPGAITQEMIASVLGRTEVDGRTLRPLGAGERPTSPGMKYRHYAPKVSMTLFVGSPEDTARAISKARAAGDGILCFDEYADMLQGEYTLSFGGSCDSAAHARLLFSRLREFDHMPVKRILAQRPRQSGREEALINRMLRAAAFCVVEASIRPVVGVTGRSGSGKSVFAAKAAELGGLVCDADYIYHRLLDEDEMLRKAIGERFPEAMNENGVDRKALGERVYGDKEALKTLNFITHPAVIKEMKRQIENTEAPFVVLDVPLLFESGLDRLCTMTVGILATEEALVLRASARDGAAPEHIRRRLASQPDEDYYRARCDVLLRNSGERSDFEKQIVKMLPGI